MSEKVVLPKFDLPGSGPHPAVRALWIVGGLFAVSMLVLGGAMWRHHAAEETAQLEAKAKIAAQAAEAEAAATAEVAAKKAKQATSAKVADKTDSTAPKGSSSTATPAGSSAVASESSHHRTSSSKHHASKPSSKGSVLAKSDGHKAAPLSKKKGDDAIDKLLASFK